ncbi:MAG TPA: hypothetical protein VF491_07360 [Vicinamibacterales bacterium]
MSSGFWKDAFGWGFILWLIGYVLGIALFAVVPPGLIGWIIMPIGAAITFWVAFKKLRGGTLGYFFLVGLAWLLIAVIGDYLFIVKALAPSDGYYKADVYLYYVLSIAIPLFAGWKRGPSENFTPTPAA